MRNKKRLMAMGLSGLAIVAMAGGAFAIHSNSTHAASAGQGTLTHLTYLGKTSFSGAGGSASNVSKGLNTDQVGPDSGDDAEFPHSGKGAVRVPADHVPQPASNAVSSDNSGVLSGFAGLDHFDSRTAGTGAYAGTQFSLEPPDQGLCVGNGYVFEGVNDALRVFHTDGTPATGTMAINQFYGLDPAINRGTGHRGAFVSDPKCYYDAPTHSWFVTVLVTAQDQTTGAQIAPAFTDVAVTTDSNPATASWNLYQFYATDDGSNGTPVHPGCPCFGDQPLIGADANGFYISTNEFPFAGGFNGAQLYAISKTGLENGTATTAVHIDVGGTMPTPDAGGIWYSIQPATTPGTGYANDTEYFLSSLQFGPAPLDNRIAVWALTGTSTLGTTNQISLTNEVIDSEVYGQPPASEQKSGSNPLGAVVTQLEGTGKVSGNNPAQKTEFLNTNDDRMNQVVYANGTLFSGVNTVVASNGATRGGIAYFIVTPSVSNGQVHGTMANQGYVSLQQDDVMFPAIAVNAAGKGVISFTVAGPDYFPSAGYATMDATHGAGAVHISGAGVGPEDGFVGYSPFANDLVSRWGDYGAAVPDENGNIWIAAEYIGQTCSLAQFEQDTTCGGTRTVLANWGTYVTEVKP